MVEYSNYNNVFLAENAAKLPEIIEINKYTIKLEEDKQSSFGLTYRLKLVKLEILKTYIKTNLANSFIWSFKSPIEASILFNQKPDKSFCFYIDY